MSLILPHLHRRETEVSIEFEGQMQYLLFFSNSYSLRKNHDAVGRSSTVLNELQHWRNNAMAQGRKPEYSAKRGQQNYEINPCPALTKPIK